MFGTYGKKALMLCLCCCLIGVLVFPASAKVINYNDYVTQVTVDGDNDVVTVRFPSGDGNGWELQGVNGQPLYLSVRGNSFNSSDLASTVTKFRALYNPIDSRDLIQIIDIPDGTVLHTQITVDASHYPENTAGSIYIDYYDDSAKFISRQAVKDTQFNPVEQPKLDLSVTIQRPEAAAYIKVRVVLENCVQNHFICTAGDLYITMSISSMLRLQQETGRTNELLQSILDELKSEEDKAESGGSSGVGDLTNAIPNHSQGFMDALHELASSMSYTGTAAKFTVPKASVPGIDGLFDGFDLTDGTLQVNFEDYIQMMPDNLLLLVQSLLTIALIVYCFKELYSTIGYVMTLKGGD